MKCPKALFNGSTIGVVVISDGVCKKLDEFSLSIFKIKENDFNVVSKMTIINGVVCNNGKDV